MSTQRIPENEPGILTYVQRKLDERGSPDETVGLASVLTLTPEIAEMLRDSGAERIHLTGTHRLLPGSLAILLRSPTLKTLSLQNLTAMSDDDVEQVTHFILGAASHIFYGSKEVDELIKQKKESIHSRGGIDAIQLKQGVEAANAQGNDTFEYVADTLPLASAETLSRFTGKKIVLSHITTMSVVALSTLLQNPNLKMLLLPSVRTLDTPSLQLLADFEVHHIGYIEIPDRLKKTYLEEKATLLQKFGENITPEEERRRLDERVRQITDMYNDLLIQDLPDTEQSENKIMFMMHISETSFRWDEKQHAMMIKAEVDGVPGYLIFPNPLSVGNRQMGPMAHLYGIDPRTDICRTVIMDPAWVPESILENPKCNFDLSKVVLEPASGIHSGSTVAIPGPSTILHVSSPTPQVVLPQLVFPHTVPLPKLAPRPLRDTQPAPFVREDVHPDDIIDLHIDDIAEVDPRVAGMQTIQHEVQEANFAGTELNILTNDDWLDAEMADVIENPAHGYKGDRLILSRIQNVDSGMLVRILSLPNLRFLSIPNVAVLDKPDLAALKAFKDRGGFVIASQAIEDALTAAHMVTDPGDIRIMERKEREEYLKYFRGIFADVTDVNFFFEGARGDIERSFDHLRFAVEGLTKDEKKMLKHMTIRLEEAPGNTGFEYLGGKNVAFQMYAGKEVTEVAHDLRNCVDTLRDFYLLLDGLKGVKKQLSIGSFAIEPGMYDSDKLSYQITAITSAISDLSPDQKKMLKAMRIHMAGGESFDMRIGPNDAHHPVNMRHFNRKVERDELKGILEAMIAEFAATPEGQKMAMAKGFSMPSMPAMPKMPSLPSMPKLSVSDTTKSVAKRVGAALAVAAIGGVGAYEALKTPAAPAPVVVSASKVPSKEALSRGTVITFKNFEEAVAKGYFVHDEQRGGYRLHRDFDLADESIPLDKNNPASLRVIKTGLRKAQ